MVGRVLFQTLVLSFFKAWQKARHSPKMICYRQIAFYCFLCHLPNCISIFIRFFYFRRRVVSIPYLTCEGQYLWERVYVIHWDGVMVGYGEFQQNVFSLVVPFFHDTRIAQFVSQNNRILQARIHISTSFSSSPVIYHDGILSGNSENRRRRSEFQL
jgi:hypothetical protein